MLVADLGILLLASAEHEADGIIVCRYPSVSTFSVTPCLFFFLYYRGQDFQGGLQLFSWLGGSHVWTCCAMRSMLSEAIMSLSRDEPDMAAETARLCDRESALAGRPWTTSMSISELLAVGMFCEFKETAS